MRCECRDYSKNDDMREIRNYYTYCILIFDNRQ